MAWAYIALWLKFGVFSHKAEKDEYSCKANSFRVLELCYYRANNWDSVLFNISYRERLE